MDNKKYMIPIAIALVILSLWGFQLATAAIEQQDITLHSPANATWWNQANYTSSFNASWDDLDDENILQANCTLLIGDIGLAGRATIEQTIIIANNTPSIFDQSNNISTMTAATVTKYWTVSCFNKSAGSSPVMRELYFKNTTPHYFIDSLSFTNATTQSSCSGWFNLNVTDTTSLPVGEFNFSIMNDSAGTQFASETTANATPVNISFTLTTDDSVYMNITLEDPAGNVNSSVEDYRFICDSTTPVITWAASTPADNSITTNNYAYFNFTVTEANNDTVSIQFNGEAPIDITDANCTKVESVLTCNYNYTVISVGRNIVLNVTVNDTTDNEGYSSDRTFSYDSATPDLSDEVNWTIVDSSAAWRFLITDTTPASCEAIVYDRSNNVARVAGTLGTVGATTNCTGAITSSQFTDMGKFTVEYNTTDDADNSNSTGINKSGVIKQLYTGWNLVTWAFTATTVLDICDTMEFCTSVSFYNNSYDANDFTTYSTATPTVNNDTSISEGDAVLVYVSAGDYLIMSEHLPEEGEPLENISLTSGGWNVFGLLDNNNLTGILDAENISDAAEGGVGNIIWDTYWNASDTTYYTCSAAANLCSGTTTLPTNINVYIGDALWVLSDGNQTINRSAIT